eukprot:CAMPEP_0197846434 /NCGR_PEP_ID=MMETSP1438-20131217/3171_1 /TAXON_ID=1461541 /ORGANISM="Pterosperma sp., Strain CCMP1384" /LENGTH=69 /DNA_ID=CAMNT_0043458083 /DNA_START=105 /DNA_END=314 /DNA_ORIENTATION=-
MMQDHPDHVRGVLTNKSLANVDTDPSSLLQVGSVVLSWVNCLELVQSSMVFSRFNGLQSIQLNGSSFYA